MSGFNSIEFGSKMGVSGDSISNRMREMRENQKAAEVTESSEPGAATFGDFLKDMVKEANSSQLNADNKMQELATGKSKDLHGTVLAMEKADINFRLLTQVRNKVIEAYREIMRMQV